MQLYQFLKMTGIRKEQLQKHMTTAGLNTYIYHECRGITPFCKSQMEYHPNGLFGSIFVDAETYEQDNITWTNTEEVYIYKLFKGMWMSTHNETKAQGMQELRAEYAHHMHHLQQHRDLLPDRKLGILPEGMGAEDFDRSMQGLEAYIKRELLIQYNVRCKTVLLCSHQPVFDPQDYFFVQVEDIVKFSLLDFGNESSALALQMLNPTN